MNKQDVKVLLKEDGGIVLDLSGEDDVGEDIELNFDEIFAKEDYPVDLQQFGLNIYNAILEMIEDTQKSLGEDTKPRFPERGRNDKL